MNVEHYFSIEHFNSWGFMINNCLKLTCTVWSKLLIILITLLVDDLVIFSPDVAVVNSLVSIADCFLLIDDCLDQTGPGVVAVVEFQPPDFFP